MTVTFTNDALPVTSVFTTMVILTVLIASVIPTQLTLFISPVLLCLNTSFPRHTSPVATIHTILY